MPLGVSKLTSVQQGVNFVILSSHWYKAGRPSMPSFENKHCSEDPYIFLIFVEAQWIIRIHTIDFDLQDKFQNANYRVRPALFTKKISRNHCVMTNISSSKRCV